MMDISIIIPACGDAIGLWLTVQSCELALAGSGITHEYCICANGDTKDAEGQIDSLRMANLLGTFVDVPELISPPAARQRASVGAKGDILFFLDNHCIPERDYFTRGLADFSALGCDLVHSTYRYYSTRPLYYHRLDAYRGPAKPCKIIWGPAGGFAVRRDVWREVGGYPDIFVGMGAEEIYLGMKMALLDKTCWIDPQLIHYHHATPNRLHPDFRSNFCQNMMTVAFCIGGRTELDKLLALYTERAQLNHRDYGECFPPNKLTQLYEEAITRGTGHAAHLASIRHRTFDEQIAKFIAEGTMESPLLGEPYP